MQTRRQLAATAAILSLLLAGCGTIRTHRNLDQPAHEILSTGVGGTIFRLNKVGDLPNAFGGRDIWGGKTDKGFAEMKLAAIDGPVLTLEVLDVNKNPTETVMDRYKPFQNRNAAVNVDASTSVTIGNEGASPYLTKLDTSKQKDITVAGIRVTFTDVQEYSVQFTLEDSYSKKSRR